MKLQSKGALKRAFTLVELLIVIVILAVLSAIILPKFYDQSKRSKESALKADLRLLRTAITSYQTDTGYYPLTLSDLTATTAPAKGYDSAAAQQNINASNWHGPYVQTSIPNDPVSSSAFTYTTTGTGVGNVSSSASGNALDGTAYSGW